MSKFATLTRPNATTFRMTLQVKKFPALNKDFWPFTTLFQNVSNRNSYNATAESLKWFFIHNEVLQKRTTWKEFECCIMRSSKACNLVNGTLDAFKQHMHEPLEYKTPYFLYEYWNMIQPYVSQGIHAIVINNTPLTEDYLNELQREVLFRQQQPQQPVEQQPQPPVEHQPQPPQPQPQPEPQPVVAVRQCQCIQINRKRCPNRAKENSMYCGVHKNCKNPILIPN